MQNFLSHILVIRCPYSPLNFEIMEFMKSGTRKTKLHFLSISHMAFQCMTLDYRHKQQYAHNEAPCSPIEQKCHFFPSTLRNKTELLVIKIKITLNCKE